MNTISEGQPVPQFSIPNQDGELVNSADFKGQKTLIYFYPKAMTPGCTVQAQGLRDSKAKLDELNVKVYGISIDAVQTIKFTAHELL